MITGQPNDVDTWGWWHVAMRDLPSEQGIPFLIFQCAMRGTRSNVENRIRSLLADMAEPQRYGLLISPWKWWHNFVP